MIPVGEKQNLSERYDGDYMQTAHIDVVNLLLMLLLVIPIIGVNHWLGIRLNRKIIISISRMIVQLSLVGVYLQYIFDLNNPVLNVIYIILMMGVATYSIIDATPLKLGTIVIPIMISLLVPNILMLLFFNGVVIRIDQLFDAKYMITIGGMILGNGLSGNIIGLSRFYDGIIEKESVYINDLMYGATTFEALKPHYRQAILACINPTIASMATIGLVSLPGMMTGQILGGSIPLEAIRYQIAIMIAIFVTKYFNLFVALQLTTRQLFDWNGRLRKEFLKKKDME